MTAWPSSAVFLPGDVGVARKDEVSRESSTRRSCNSVAVTRSRGKETDSNTAEMRTAL